MINQSEIKKLLNYDPDTGEFKWRVTRGKKLEGSIAGGTLNPMWVEWLMGYPTGWTEVKGQAVPLCRTWQK